MSNPYQPPIDDKLPVAPAPDPDGPIVFSFNYSADHYVETLRRYRLQSPADKMWSWLRYILATLILIFVLYVLSRGTVALAIPLALFSVLLLFSQSIAYRKARKIFFSSPYCDSRQMMQISSEGIYSQSEFESSQSTWQAFSKAVFFDDGLLLFRGLNMVHWLPYSSLEKPADAQRLRELISAVLPVGHST